MERSSNLLLTVLFFLFFLNLWSLVDAETEVGVPTLIELVEDGGKEEIIRLRGLEFRVNRTMSHGSKLMTEGDDECNDKVLGFLGLRFGESVSGVKRWTAPVVHALSIRDIIDATQFGPSCPQTASVFLRSQPQEDCLFLNLWAPKTALSLSKKRKKNDSSGSLLPVLVFIHGGAFYMGSANDPYIDGVPLTKTGSEDIIVISINYRLGVFGFLAHPSLTETQPTAPTNFGLLDQRAALIWVQRHIRLFGGDPNRVTIAGESAGAMSVVSHLIALPSPTTLEYPKLFHRAIIQSASANYPNEPLEEAETLGREVAKGLGCQQQQTSSLASELECLRTVPMEELILYQTMNPNTKSYRRTILFHSVGSNPRRPMPVGDGINFPKVHSTIDALESPHRDPSIDVIVGSTEDEGTLFVTLAFPFVPPSQELFHDIIDALFSVVEDPIERDAIVQKALQRYFHGATEKNGINNTLAALSGMLGHLFFTCPTQRSARHLASYVSTATLSSGKQGTGRGRVYNYVFKVRSPDSSLGSFHASELPYIFGTTPGGILFPSSFTPGEELVSQAMIHAWTSFVATGIPAFPERTGITVHEWPEFTLAGEEVVEFLNEGEVRVEAKYGAEDCPELWDKVYHRVPFLPHDELAAEPLWSYFLNGYVLASLRYQRNKFLMGVCLVLLVMVWFVWKLLRCCWTSSGVVSRRARAGAGRGSNKRKND